MHTPSDVYLTLLVETGGTHKAMFELGKGLNWFNQQREHAEEACFDYSGWEILVAMATKPRNCNLFVPLHQIFGLQSLRQGLRDSIGTPVSQKTLRCGHSTASFSGHDTSPTTHVAYRINVICRR
jgi:hypothetical protein